MSTTTHPTLAMSIKDESFFKDLGSRIAQQTLAHFEGGRLRLPASLLPTLAQELRLPVEGLLGQSSATKARAKRGPATALAQHMGRIGALPKPQQKFVI